MGSSQKGGGRENQRDTGIIKESLSIKRYARRTGGGPKATKLPRATESSSRVARKPNTRDHGEKEGPPQGWRSTSPTGLVEASRIRTSSKGCRGKQRVVRRNTQKYQRKGEHRKEQQPLCRCTKACDHGGEKTISQLRGGGAVGQPRHDTPPTLKRDKWTITA